MAQVRSARSEIWREPARGGFIDAGLLNRPWIEILQAIHSGDAPQPPIAHLCGRRLVHLAAGQASIAMPASDWFLGPKGHLDTGIFAFLADMTHFYAVLATLPIGGGCATAELSMTFLGQPPSGGGEITAQSRVVFDDDRNALAEGFVQDAEGRVVAHSTSRYFRFPPGGWSLPPRLSASPSRETPSTPDPVFGAVKPTVAPLGEETLRHRSGLEILQAQIEGDLPPPPLDQLTGMRLEAAEDGVVVFALPAHAWLPQEIGTVFGGMIALLAKSAAAGAVQAVAPAGTGFTALDLKVNFLRPVPADGTAVTATGRVIHRGSRLTIANAEIVHGGRQVALATGTTALSPASGLA